jgi:hypothetical protein
LALQTSGHLKTGDARVGEGGVTLPRECTFGVDGLGVGCNDVANDVGEDRQGRGVGCGVSGGHAFTPWAQLRRSANDMMLSCPSADPIAMAASAVSRGEGSKVHGGACCGHHRLVSTLMMSAPMSARYIEMVGAA